MASTDPVSIPATLVAPPIRTQSRRFRTALRKDLPAGWYGWHSLRIRDPNGYEGEGDFVLAHPQRGFLVLEVKGGQVEQRDGRWFQNGRPMDEPPLEQGTGFAKKLARRLQNLECTAPSYGAGVCFPNITSPANRPRTTSRASLLERVNSHLAVALPAVMERALPVPRPSRGRWIEALHRLWGDTWIPALALGMRAEEAMERRLGLDQAQLEVLDGLVENDRVLVQGSAGSGKTLLAAEAARRLSDRKKKVLLLCFTAPLQKWLASRLTGSGVEVHTVSGFAKGLVDASGGGLQDADLSGAAGWGKVFERAADLCQPTWDALVIDEAQDLQFEAWVLVSSLSQGKRLWAFHDPTQGFWADRSPPVDLFTTRFRLPGQLRNPPGVKALSDRILGKPSDDAALTAARADGTIGVVVAPTSSSVVDRVSEEVDRLRSGGLELGQIGIVSLRGQTAPGAIYGLPRIGRHPFVRGDSADMETSLVADSFLRWKGLERPAIIVTDIPETALTQLPVRLNVALTRAMLTVRFVGTATALDVAGLSR